MNAKQYEEYKKSVESALRGLTGVSTGACPGCEECGLPDNPDVRDIESAGEASFSWHACEVCGSTLGGDRHPAHALDADGRILHFSVCVDCLYFLNYGQLDDMSMLDMEKEEE